MPPSNKHFNKAIGIIANATAFVASFGLALMTMIIAWQVVGRYALNDSPPWSEPLALIVMIYVVMLAAAVGVYEKFHLGVRVFVAMLSPRWQRWIFVVGQLCIASFGLVMAWQGGQLVDFTSGHIIPAIEIPRSVAYWPFVMAGTLITIFALVHCVLALQSDGVNDPWN